MLVKVSEMKLICVVCTPKTHQKMFESCSKNSLFRIIQQNGEYRLLISIKISSSTMFSSTFSIKELSSRSQLSSSHREPQ